MTKQSSLSDFILLGSVALACAVLPALLIAVGAIDGYTAQIFTLAGINAIMAISVNIITGMTGQLSLGQAGFMAVGAYACIWFTQVAHVPLPVSVVIAGAFAAVIGFFIGFPTLKLSGDYLAIVTLGFGEIIRVVFVNLKGLTGGPNGMRFMTVLSQRADVAWVVVIGALVLVVALLQNFLRSTYGRAVFAVREDEIAAASNGIGVFGYKMTGFVIAAFVAGIGGALYAALIGFVKPELASFNRSVDYLIYVVLGGMGSITGSILSAFILTYLQEFLRFLKDYRLLIYPVILIFVMLFRPQGLLGMKELSFTALRDRVLSQRIARRAVRPAARQGNAGKPADGDVGNGDMGNGEYGEK